MPVFGQIMRSASRSRRSHTGSLNKTRKNSLPAIGKLWIRPKGKGPQAMREKAAALSIIQHSIRKGVMPRPLYI